MFIFFHYLFLTCSVIKSSAPFEAAGNGIQSLNFSVIQNSIIPAAEGGGDI
jgi:hypothetical protein